MSQEQKFKKGDRVRAISATVYDIQGGVQVGMVGTVVKRYGHEVIIHFDGFVPTADARHCREDGYYMLDSQLELVEAEKTPAPAHPTTSYVLSNADLQQAIEKTRGMITLGGYTEADKELKAHLSGLLAIQLARASKESAA